MIKVTPANPRLDSGSSFEDLETDDDVEDGSHLRVPNDDDEADSEEEEIDEEQERIFIQSNVWQISDIYCFQDLINSLDS